MKIISVVIFCAFAMQLNAQYYVAGDTVGRYIYSPEYSFYNSSVSVNVDCDDSADVFFDSKEANMPYNWPRLTFYMNGAEVLNSGVGRVSVFYPGDTVLFTDSLWTPWLDYVWGEGVTGQYGIHQIDTAYIAFRKRNSTGDTVYTFLNVSTLGVQMTIHHIISTCSSNPLQLVSSVNEKPDNGLPVYPNPFTDWLSFSNVYGKEMQVTLYNYVVQQVLQTALTNNQLINTAHLVNGVYFYELRTDKAVVKYGKVVKR